MLLAALELAFVAGFPGRPGGGLAGDGPGGQGERRASGERLVASTPSGRGVGWAYFLVRTLRRGGGGLPPGHDHGPGGGKVYLQTLASPGWPARWPSRAGWGKPYAPRRRKAADPDWRDSILGEWEIIVRWLAGDFAAALSGARELVAWNAAASAADGPSVSPSPPCRRPRPKQTADGPALPGCGRAAYRGQALGHLGGMLPATSKPSSPGRTAIGRGRDRAAAHGREDARDGGRPWAAFVLLDLAEVAAEAARGTPSAAARAARTAGRDRRRRLTVISTGRWPPSAPGGRHLGLRAQSEPAAEAGRGGGRRSSRRWVTGRCWAAPSTCRPGPRSARPGPGPHDPRAGGGHLRRLRVPPGAGTGRSGHCGGWGQAGKRAAAALGPTVADPPGTGGGDRLAAQRSHGGRRSPGRSSSASAPWRATWPGSTPSSGWRPSGTCFGAAPNWASSPVEPDESVPRSVSGTADGQRFRTVPSGSCTSWRARS